MVMGSGGVDTGGELLPLAVAMLLIVPDVAAAVWLATWTVADFPAARSPNAQVSVCGALGLLTMHAGSAGLRNQLTPGTAGSGSLSVTFFAVAVPPLLTLMVKPMSSPELTEALSAVFATASLGCGGSG